MAATQRRRSVLDHVLAGELTDEEAGLFRALRRLCPVMLTPAADPG